MARREGLYEVDGELVSERTPPVRWRALSYTQPMSERVPGRGKGKLMRVMFDSNTTRFAPLRRARDKSARSKHASCKIAPMRFALLQMGSGEISSSEHGPVHLDPAQIEPGEIPSCQICR